MHHPDFEAMAWDFERSAKRQVAQGNSGDEAMAERVMNRLGRCSRPD